MIAVFSSPSIIISENAGITAKFFSLGATKPLAIQIALIAWFNEPAPIVWISTTPSLYTGWRIQYQKYPGHMRNNLYKTFLSA